MNIQHTRISLTPQTPIEELKPYLDNLKSKLPQKNRADIHFDPQQVKTPAYVIDEDLLEANLQLLSFIKQTTGCRILLAQKAYALTATYPQIAKHLDGTTSSGLFEAQLGHDYFPGETHVFSPAYKAHELEQLCTLCDHIIFNDCDQIKENHRLIQENPQISFGLRINPEFSTQDHGLYDPCAPTSRLGTTLKRFDPAILPALKGLHCHTLCEQGFEPLNETVAVIEEKFGRYLHQLEWLNLGGGHHLTASDYDVLGLIQLIRRLQTQYHLTIYLEPGEAVVLNTGFMVAEVVGITHHQTPIALLDASAECHMPDVLAMPYTPLVLDGQTVPLSELDPNQKHLYQLAGCTCLAGDIIGFYQFDHPIHKHDHLVFFDMALYSFVKNNTFNGMPLPSLVCFNSHEGLKIVKSFGYHDFAHRLSP